MAELITLVQWKLPLTTAAKIRVCRKCNEAKDKDEFKVDHTCADNRRHICISCEKERDRKNKETRDKRKAGPNPEKYFTF